MTEADFSLHLDAVPSDRQHRLVYADWLEEAGRDHDAYVQRWLSTRGLWPRRDILSRQWVWYLDYPQVRPEGLRHDCLPPPVFWCLPGTKHYEQQIFYRSRQKAEADLAQALLILRDVLALGEVAR